MTVSTSLNGRKPYPDGICRCWVLQGTACRWLIPSPWITLAIETVIKGAIDTDTVTLETSGVQVDESGEPEGFYIVNGIPAPSIGSNEVWFLVELAPGQWREVDSDDAQFARSGDKLTALASTAGPAARKIENLGFNNLVAGLN